MIKEFLRLKLGTTYAAVTAPSDENKLVVDMSDWGGRQRPRACAPWTKLRRTGVSNGAYVLTQIAKLCPWHSWQP